MSIDSIPTPPNAANDTERQQADTLDGSDPGGAQPVPTPDPAASEGTAEAQSSNGPSTLPLSVVDAPSGTSTTPLPGLGGPPTPLLEMGTLLGGRYEVVLFMTSLGNTNIYRVLDQQGFRRCWACGSTNSAPGDMYCVECGAQLTGRYYRVQEFSASPGETPDDPTQTTEQLDPDSSINPQPALERSEGSEIPNSKSDSSLTIPVPEAILANRVGGVVQAVDAIAAPELGRVYVVWEEAYGRTLSSWLPDAGTDIFSQIQAGQSGQLSIDEPSDEQALAWMAQSAEILANLHAEGILGCNVELNNLLVQLGDRVLLLDPSECRQADGVDTSASQASDVRALAGELERWYMSVRRDTGALSIAEEQAGAAAGNGRLVVASEVTGPLANMLNPSVALSKAREGSLPTAAAFAKVLREIYEASRPLRNLQLWSGRASDVGRVRQINEDSVLTFEATVLEHEGGLPVGLYVVADGMGGHQSGEVASSIAVRTIVAVVNSSLIGPMLAGDPVACDPITCTNLLRQAIMEANRRISDLARERHSDLGTTAVAAIMVGNQLCVANVGDSRAYFWHEGQVTPITRDHSLVAQLVAAGQIKPDDIYTHPRRNEIYRALGESRLAETDVDVFTRRLQPGDGLLVCSDGLWDFVRDPDISAAINAGAEPQAICHALIDLANQGGGEDNISAIFVRVVPSKRSKE
ncbi:MAG TPA: protein phosphatase 2C domain-containing protein [Chloroflexia bacterium]|nr:protein phosphatase 2C domain-containing protein [Chloroflexia bacterium]